MCSSPLTTPAAHSCCLCPCPGRMATAVPNVLQVAVVAGRRATEVVHIVLLARVRWRHLFVAAPAPAMRYAVAMVACSSPLAEQEPTANRLAAPLPGGGGGGVRAAGADRGRLPGSSSAVRGGTGLARRHPCYVAVSATAVRLMVDRGGAPRDGGSADRAAGAGALAAAGNGGDDSAVGGVWKVGGGRCGGPEVFVRQRTGSREGVRIGCRCHLPYGYFCAARARPSVCPISSFRGHGFGHKALQQRLRNAILTRMSFTRT